MPRPRKSKASAQALKYARVVRQALSLRESGFSYQAISEKVCYDDGKPAWKTPAGCQKAIFIALAEITKESAETLLTLELNRLDKYLAALDAGVNDGDPAAIKAAVKIQERRSKLQGLDAAMKVQVQQAPADSKERLVELFATRQELWAEMKQKVEERIESKQVAITDGGHE